MVSKKDTATESAGLVQPTKDALSKLNKDSQLGDRNNQLNLKGAKGGSEPGVIDQLKDSTGSLLGSNTDGTGYDNTKLGKSSENQGVMASIRDKLPTALGGTPNESQNDSILNKNNNDSILNKNNNDSLLNNNSNNMNLGKDNENSGVMASIRDKLPTALGGTPNESQSDSILNKNSNNSMLNNNQNKQDDAGWLTKAKDYVEDTIGMSNKSTSNSGDLNQTKENLSQSANNAYETMADKVKNVTGQNKTQTGSKVDEAKDTLNKKSQDAYNVTAGKSQEASNSLNQGKGYGQAKMEDTQDSLTKKAQDAYDTAAQKLKNVGNQNDNSLFGSSNNTTAKGSTIGQHAQNAYDTVAEKAKNAADYADRKNPFSDSLSTDKSMKTNAENAKTKASKTAGSMKEKANQMVGGNKEE